MLGNIGEHVFTALDVFVEKIGSQLRVENTRGADGKKHQQQDGNDGDEETSDDEAIAQAPEQAAPSPGEKPIEEIEGGKKPNEFQIIEDFPAGFEEVREPPGKR
jgi:hypothetical protein